MVEILLKNYRLKNSIAIGFAILVLVSSAINSYITYTYEKNNLYETIDARLKVAAINIDLILKNDFFDRAIDKDSISNDEDMQNTLLLSKYVKNLASIEYVYSMVQKDNKIYFINSSAKDDEIGTDDMTLYYDEYDEATELLKSVLKNNKIVYEESTDKWGTFRTVFIPMKTKNNHRYIVGADIKIDFIKHRLDELINNIIYTQLLIIFILMLLGWYFIAISKKEFLYITKIKNNLDKEIEDKTKALASLNQSLEKRVEEEVLNNHRKDQQLLEQNRLAQMGEMLAMIAHQWRQPLAAISSVSNVIVLKAQLNTLTTKMSMEFAQKIINYTHHLSSTIDDFRDFFKSDKTKKETTYEQMVNSVLNIIENALINNNIKLDINIDSEVVFYTYPNEIHQVLLNILKNAQDAIVENGIENPIIKIDIKDNICSISDNANGIPEDIIDKIFDPYFSTKHDKNGTGLGLYMSKMIIEDHCNGKLNVENIKDGVKFTIILDNK